MSNLEYSDNEGKELITYVKEGIDKMNLKEPLSILEGVKYKQARGVIISVMTDKGMILEMIETNSRSLNNNLLEAMKKLTVRTNHEEIINGKIRMIILSGISKISIKEINPQKDVLKCKYYMREGMILPEEANPLTGMPTSDKIKYLERLCSKTGIPKDSWEKEKFELWKYEGQTFEG